MAKILIIDDDVINGQLYVNKLKNLGHEVVQAEDAEKALDALVQQFNLILLDLMIPKGDGITLLQTIKSGINRLTIVIVFTNLMGEDTKQKCLELGATDVWYKIDFTPQKLMEKLERYVQ